jgi:acetate kinase
VRAAAPDNPRARHALDIFCYRIRKYLGAYAAALGGVDAVVFTAGIGENEPHIRADSVAGLDFLGLVIDEARNNAPKRQDVPGWDIGQEGAAARLLVIPTDEELMIARDTMVLVS